MLKAGRNFEKLTFWSPKGPPVSTFGHLGPSWFYIWALGLASDSTDSTAAGAISARRTLNSQPGPHPISQCFAQEENMSLRGLPCDVLVKVPSSEP